MDTPETLPGVIGETRQAKRKIKFSSLVVVIMILMLLTYVGVALWLTWLERTVPDSLTISVVSAVTGEFGVLGWIRVKGS